MRVLLLVMGLAAFGSSILAIIDVRTEIQQLTANKNDLRWQLRRLEDERRNLHLEIATFTEYARVESTAIDLGMVEPSLDDGSLVYVSRQRGH